MAIVLRINSANTSRFRHGFFLGYFFGNKSLKKITFFKGAYSEWGPSLKALDVTCSFI